MKLEIPIQIDKFKIDIRFIKLLIPYIKHNILQNINNIQLSNIDRYVEESNILNDYKTKNVTFKSRRIIIMAINNLTVNKGKDYYIIEIDNNIIYPGYSITLENLCKLINFGNMDIKGYPIITNAFNHITVNVRGYFNRYFKTTL